MIVFRYNLTGSIKEINEFGQKLANCGAIVFLKSGETNFYNVGIPTSTQNQVLSCLQHNLSKEEYAQLEHGIVDYEQRLNYYIDALAEQGFNKLDESTVKTAEWLVFNDVIGEEYHEVWDLLTKMGQTLEEMEPTMEERIRTNLYYFLEDTKVIVKPVIDKFGLRAWIIWNGGQEMVLMDLRENIAGIRKINKENVTFNDFLEAANNWIDELRENKFEGLPTKMGRELPKDTINKYDELKRKFDEEFNKMSNEEVEKFDEWFNKEILPFVLTEFYGGYHPKGLKAEEKKQRYIDYIYMYMIANHLKELDERYAQPIFAEAQKYAESI